MPRRTYLPWPRAGFQNAEPVQARPGGAPGAKMLAGLLRRVPGLGGATQADENQVSHTRQVPDAGNLPGLARRPTYTMLGQRYHSALPAPRMGPAPHLARGSTHTGRRATPGTSAQFPAYMHKQEEYHPQGLEYMPATNPNDMWHPPRSIAIGVNGRDLVSTYEPHDWVMAVYTQTQWGSSGMWEQLSYPGNFRKLIQAQAPQRYNLATHVGMARPMSPNDYFLGYVTSPRVAGQIGASVGLPLGQGGA